MTSPLSILSVTSQAYAHWIRQQLGKGFQHAELIYQEWFRTGKVEGNHPAFKNAQSLLKDILSLTDFSVLPISNNLTDGQTGKILLKTADELEIESVLIPMQAGNTLCISSQVGCRMGCAFCETGKMGLLRNLSVQEIVSQFFIAKFHLNFSVRNVVFMGMGEPFDNYDNVMQACKVLTDDHGLGLGFHHITISTSGCLEGIIKLMNENSPLPNLAVSLNAPTDELRNKLMPINKIYGLKELHQTISAFCKKTGKQILIAYVLIKGENDSLKHADQLAEFLTGLDVKINVIPYNPQSRDRFQCPDQSTLDEFTNYLRHKGYYTLLRQTKGQKIMAACGQLGNLALKRKKSLLSITQVN